MLDLFFVISFWQRFTSCKHISKYPIAAEQKKKKKKKKEKQHKDILVQNLPFCDKIVVTVLLVFPFNTEIKQF